ncbi:MAG: glycerophosphodiester phosphodiesterase [Agriterribacter sp.]
MIKRSIFFAAIVLALIAAIGIISINTQFAEISFTHALKDKPQLWSHRGIGTKYPENSIQAFAEAIKNNATGIEIDVFFNKESDLFLVTHDPPKNDSSYIDLEQYFKRFLDSTFYWIDLKNLDKDNSNLIAQKLSHLSKRYNLSGRIFIESSNAEGLYEIKKRDLRTLYWLQYNRENFIRKELKLLYLKHILLKYKFDAISTSSSFYDQNFKQNFPAIPLFIFHPESEEKLRKLLSDSNVNVVLTDGKYNMQQ